MWYGWSLSVCLFVFCQSPATAVFSLLCLFKITLQEDIFLFRCLPFNHVKEKMLTCSLIGNIAWSISESYWQTHQYSASCLYGSLHVLTPLGSWRPLMASQDWLSPQDIYRLLPLERRWRKNCAWFPGESFMAAEGETRRWEEFGNIFCVDSFSPAEGSKGWKPIGIQALQATHKARGFLLHHRVNGARWGGRRNNIQQMLNRKGQHFIFRLPPHPQTRFPRYIIRVWLSVNIGKVVVWPFEVNLR